jgi:hypothetical protein
MISSDKDALAKDVVERWIDFEMALSDKRRYPKLQFEHFLKSAWTYSEQVRHDKLVHREVVSIVNHLVEYLGCERKRIPENVIYDAERLESLLFDGYDPHFEGDEPPGL